MRCLRSSDVPRIQDKIGPVVWIVFCVACIFLAFGSKVIADVTRVVPPAASIFPLKDVRLSGGPLKHSQNTYIVTAADNDTSGANNACI